MTTSETAQTIWNWPVIGGLGAVALACLAYALRYRNDRDAPRLVFSVRLAQVTVIALVGSFCGFVASAFGLSLATCAGIGTFVGGVILTSGELDECDGEPLVRWTRPSVLKAEREAASQARRSSSD